ncbi:ATP-grasp domain-containing protein [Heyndrickxia camelliae]|uniref:Carbamoylphosphate synthase large subunit n=1 Tax=Heyndrickxia camelliae TaxID=1707093 RepID=A0A2N3LLQ4_9BACI|nr:ATP-grasp domain-containing protein [Heyndrickxia camelliae]PKR85560.1 carbamoylphosphate synthase large subunit [Heyndrickxia camelliae]
MNILISSAGRRVKLMQYFKEELHRIGGKLIAVDCDATAPAFSFADYAETVPQITHPDYIKTLLDICKKHHVHAILSLIDPELSILANHKTQFFNENIKIIVSNKEVVDLCLDKYRTFQFLKNHALPFVPTYIKKDEIVEELQNHKLAFPLISKPRYGSASLGMTVIQSLKELETLWLDNNSHVIQPFISGEEYGIDGYIDFVSSQTTNLFCKRKLKMRAGETDKSISVLDEELSKLIAKVIQHLKPIGPIDIDCFKTDKGYLVSEINPRFGGGYPHAHEMGHNFVKNIINNLLGKPNKVMASTYSEGAVMIKFDDIMVLPSIVNISQ